MFSALEQQSEPFRGACCLGRMSLSVFDRGRLEQLRSGSMELADDRWMVGEWRHDGHHPNLHAMDARTGTHRCESEEFHRLVRVYAGAGFADWSLRMDYGASLHDAVEAKRKHVKPTSSEAHQRSGHRPAFWFIIQI